MTTRTYPEGVTSWVDVEVDDAEAAAAFYGGLFGWTFTQVTPDGVPSRYLVAQLEGQDVAGVGSPARGRAAWNTYVAVDDADAAAARVQAAGGRVVDPPDDAGEGGRSVACTDPAGVAFRLWQARRRPGAQLTNAPGTWNFSDLHATDPAASMRFYAEVFGWEVSETGFAQMLRRPGYGEHLAATVDPDIEERQGEVGAPAGFADAIGWLVPVAEGRPPGWHVTFTVTDRDDSAALAERLGGRVLGSEDSAWTRTALLRDPQGAELTVSQFTPPAG